MVRKPLKKRVVRKKQDRVGLRIILLVAWFLAGLYAGLGGWVKLYADQLQQQAVEAQLKVDCSDPGRGFEYKGETFCTLEDIAIEQYAQGVNNLGLSWGFRLPNPLPMLLTAFAFGAVGSVVRIVRTIIGSQELPSFYTLSLAPALGGMTALMLLGLSSLAPYVFSESKILLSPLVIPFLSLFAGAFSEHIQRWFQTLLDKTFKIQKEKKNGA